VENNAKFLAWHWWEAKAIGPSPSYGFAVLFGSKGRKKTFQECSVDCHKVFQTSNIEREIKRSKRTISSSSSSDPTVASPLCKQS
jgi:hypothetical protein